MLDLAGPSFARQECAHCRAHTCDSVCGCCGSNRLTPLRAAPAIIPLAESELVTHVAAVPFTRWAP